MPHVHLANIPLHICWRPRDVEPLVQATPIDGVHIVHPDRHPYTLVRTFVAGRTESHRASALAPTALSSLAKKDLAFTGADSSECRRRAPVPCFLPPELFEPGETLLNVRDVQDRRQPFCIHVSFFFDVVTVIYFVLRDRSV